MSQCGQLGRVLEYGSSIFTGTSAGHWGAWGEMRCGRVDQPDRQNPPPSLALSPCATRGKKEKSVCWRLGQMRNANAAAAPIPVCLQATEFLSRLKNGTHFSLPGWVCDWRDGRGILGLAGLKQQFIHKTKKRKWCWLFLPFPA